MRYNEHINQQSEEKPAKEEKKEPRILAGSKDFDYNNLSSGKKPPIKGGNSFG